jgi:hypothetical protein
MSISLPEARHQAANLLYTYTEVADRKDVEAAVELLSSAAVQFPGKTATGTEEVRQHFAGLWSAPGAHRHVVTNLIVEPTAEATVFTARALYTRWLFDPDPVITTMGQYDVVVERGEYWRIRSLQVSRTWQSEG